MIVWSFYHKRFHGNKHYAIFAHIGPLNNNILPLWPLHANVWSLRPLPPNMLTLGPLLTNFCGLGPLTSIISPTGPLNAIILTMEPLHANILPDGPLYTKIRSTHVLMFTISQIWISVSAKLPRNGRTPLRYQQSYLEKNHKNLP